jgi:hypothetical protein
MAQCVHGTRHTVRPLLIARLVCSRMHSRRRRCPIMLFRMPICMSICAVRFKAVLRARPQLWAICCAFSCTRSQWIMFVGYVGCCGHKWLSQRFHCADSGGSRGIRRLLCCRLVWKGRWGPKGKRVLGWAGTLWTSGRFSMCMLCARCIHGGSGGCSLLHRVHGRSWLQPSRGCRCFRRFACLGGLAPKVGSNAVEPRGSLKLCHQFPGLRKNALPL